MQFHTTERLGEVQSLTKEGFLICAGVPISRTGLMIYAPGELPLEPGRDGLIRVHRNADAVFEDSAMQSFEGKSIVDLHPSEDVTSANWRHLAVGHVQNVRRGEGENSDKVIADLVIKDARAIDQVRQGKRHVSCGYDAQYRNTAPGNYDQVGIVGNHVALVPEGRCGPSCSIGDSAMLIPARTVIDRIRSAFQVQDETMLGAALAEIPVTAPTAHTAGAAMPSIHIHTARDEVPAFLKKEGEDTPEDKKDDKATKDMAAAILKLADTVGKIETRMGTMDAAIKAITTTKDADEKTDKEAELAKAAAEAEVARLKREEEEKDKEEEVKTGDSAGMAAAWQDVIGRAEILVPGIRMPTFDAKAKPKTTLDALCTFKRHAMTVALSGVGKAHVEASTPSGSTIAAMTCDAVALVFHGASELAKVKNNQGASSRDQGGNIGRTKGAQSPADINAKNRAYYKV